MLLKMKQCIMNNKKALIIYDAPFVEVVSGTHNRVYNILRRLKELDISIDQLIKSERDLNIDTTGSLIDKIIAAKKQASFFKKLKMTFKTIKDWKREDRGLFKRVGLKPRKINILIDNLKEQINVDDYDYVISVNSDNAFWIDAFGEKTKKILLMDDVMYNQFKDKNPKDVVERCLEYYKTWENKIVNKFDCIIGISQDEINLFKNEQNEHKFVYIPPLMQAKNIEKKDCKYDIIYVAHDNVHNVKACKWFLDNVYPKIENFKILFIGRICKTIENKQDYKSIGFIDFVENLDDSYNSAKISICPMFSGTGIKIKVVESLGYGKPVVCNKMGTIGLPDFKDIENKAVFVSDDADGFAKHIYNLLENKELYDKASDIALTYFNKYFLVEKNVEKIKKIFIN